MNPVTFSALAEPSRFHIVELLRNKPYTVGQIADRLHIRQPQASKHLKVLADAGLIAVHPQANQRIYALSPKKFQEIDRWLEKYRQLWEDRLDRLDAFLKGGEKK
ncbi:MAG TPA: metalloregulator ArsR/SmtB family transcription factor [Candidatus Saccharimonadales bacterium]|nr:metalloregulator ArsR/SmtB family transcription factor [Candidatus Saccharimonadales bacterium]